MFENLAHEALIEVFQNCEKAARSKSFLKRKYHNLAVENCKVANDFYRKAGVNIQIKLDIPKEGNLLHAVLIKGQLPPSILKRITKLLFTK